LTATGPRGDSTVSLRRPAMRRCIGISRTPNVGVSRTSSVANRRTVLFHQHRGIADVQCARCQHAIQQIPQLLARDVIEVRLNNDDLVTL
jgi:hypothetical protein